MKEFVPSYELYREIIRDIKITGKYYDYVEAEHKENFIIMRHDVEFSVERAYKMSLVESNENFTSTYFIQITNNSYNAFSRKNIELLHDIADRGHRIGLHYHLNEQLDQIIVRDGVRDQVRIMSEMLNMKIDRYSFHRPVKEVYYYNISIPGIINAYSPHFFSYTENVTKETDLYVKYISDSKHRWNYAYPDYETLMRYPRIQILIHPFSWTETGYDNKNNFISLIEEKNSELIDTLDYEFLRFREVRKKIGF